MDAFFSMLSSVAIFVVWKLFPISRTDKEKGGGDYQQMQLLA